MPTTQKTGSRTGATSKIGAKIANKPVRNASPDARAWKGAVLQTAREGRAIDIITLLADLEISNDITREPEETDVDPAGLETKDALDTDVELSDEDDPHLPGLDEEAHDFRDPAYAPGKGEDGEDESSDLPRMKIEILVTEGHCRIHRPAWMRAQPLTDSGQEFLDEIGKRFTVLDAVGDWLSKNRIAFVKTPDPWQLGVEALSEMRRGYAPVSQGSFLAMTGLEKVVSPQTFSRNTTDCFLVWEDGTLPLDFIFGREARMAWVANAVIQFAHSQGNDLTEPDLDRFKGITVPGNKDEKNRLSTKQVEQLDFGEFVAKANLMADTKWTDVVRIYRKRFLGKQP